MVAVGAMSIVYRREGGALVSDTVELDEHFHGRRVVACYAATRS